MPDTPQPPDLPLNGLLGHGARYEGDLSFEGRVRLDGHFVGRIYTEDVLEVGETGLIEGEADVARAIVAGTVRGRMLCREHLEVASTGLVEGQLDAVIVDLHPGGRLVGQVRISGRPTPDVDT